MAKSQKFTAEELPIITSIQQERNSTRKAAVQYFKRHRDEYMPKNTKAAAAPALDVKQRAANDVEFANPVDAPVVIDNPNAKKTRKPKTVGQAVAKAVNKVEAGAARAEGLRLYKLAGRPTKAQFIKVYGKRGHLMTWDQRAEAGVPAAKFQAALAEKQGK